MDLPRDLRDQGARTGSDELKSTKPLQSGIGREVVSPDRAFGSVPAGTRRISNILVPFS